MNQITIDEIIKRALIEDMNYGDITTESLGLVERQIGAKLRAKESGTLSGLEVFKRVFELVDAEIEVTLHYGDGEVVRQGDEVAYLRGSAISVLKAERTALNLLQRMSGIATITAKYVEAVRPFSSRIVDTRKTAPGLRLLDKQAVLHGGGYNHRFNLSDAVMIKDNHIRAVGSILEAVRQARAVIPHTMRIEVEVESLKELEEAIDAGADIVMLDNMTGDVMEEAVKINRGRVILEASGNVTLKTVEKIAQTGVDVISVGALTHSVKAMDLSLKFDL